MGDRDLISSGVHSGWNRQDASCCSHSEESLPRCVIGLSSGSLGSELYRCFPDAPKASSGQDKDPDTSASQAADKSSTGKAVKEESKDDYSESADSLSDWSEDDWFLSEASERYSRFHCLLVSLLTTANQH